MKTQRNEPRISVQNIYFKYSSSSKEDTQYMKQSDSSRIDEILDVVTVILALSKSTRTIFHPCSSSRRACITFSFQSTPLGTNSSHVWRDTSRLMIFLFLSNTRSLFPLILLSSSLFSLSLSLCMYVRIHILPHLFANRWRQTESIPNGFFFLTTSQVFHLLLERYHFKFKIYSYTPRETNSMDSWSK